VAGLELALSQFPLARSLGHIGLYAPALLIGYLLAVRTVLRYERSQLAAGAEQAASRYPDMSLRQAAWCSCVAGGVVVAAGIWLPFVGNGLAHAMQWTQSFVGMLLVVMVTSQPELVVTLSALRLGAVDMAIANRLCLASATQSVRPAGAAALAHA